MPDRTIIHLKETVSTNAYIKELCKSNTVEEGLVVCADFQTAGRGQKGNSWESEAKKNLLFSMVLYPQFIEANEQFIISQLVSVAIKNVLDKYTDNISIKWPNDIYWKQQKICGLLIENDLMECIITQSVIGVGLNVNQQEFRSDAPNPVSLKQILGCDNEKEIILKEIIEEILLQYNIAKKDTKSIADKYKQHLYRKDGYYNYSDGETSFKAKIEDVETSGILVLKTDTGMLRKFAFKEVTFR